MNLQHLKYFCDTVRTGSLSRAAELNFVGQPAISKAIKSLELDLGVALALHQRNRFELTDEGTRVFESSGDVFDSVQALQDNLNNSVKPKGDVFFSCQSSMAESDFLASTLKRVQERFPEINVHLTLGRTDIVKSWLQETVINFAIVLNNRDFSSFDSTVINKGSFLLVKSSQHKKNWKQEGIITTESTKETQLLQKLFTKKNGYQFKHKMIIGSWGAIKNFVHQGLGVGFIPDYLIKRELSDGTLNLLEPKTYSVPYDIILISQRGRYLPARSQVVMREFYENSTTNSH